jgi:hypothetical protein
MRSYQVFAAMSPQRAGEMMRVLQEKAPAMVAQSVAVACGALRMRPAYLKRQPLEKRAEAVRRTCARVVADSFAAELLAVYFLECRRELLVEWLDLIGLEHEEGTLKSDAPPPPPDAKLRKAVEGFRAVDADADRELLLRAFAAQSAIEWPALDALLES